MLKKITLCLVTLIVVLGLTACGFHLRNQGQLSQSIHTLYLETSSPYGSLESNLSQTLRSSGVTLVDKAKAAPITLQLSKPIESDINATIGPSSQSRAYTLTYQVSYTLKNAQGKVLLGPETVTTTRNFILEANQLPQSNNQMSVLRYEMERDIVNQLYNRLRSKQVAQITSR